MNVLRKGDKVRITSQRSVNFNKTGEVLAFYPDGMCSIKIAGGRTARFSEESVKKLPSEQTDKPPEKTSKSKEELLNSYLDDLHMWHGNVLFYPEKFDSITDFLCVCDLLEVQDIGGNACTLRKYLVDLCDGDMSDDFPFECSIIYNGELYSFDVDRSYTFK